MAYTEKEERKKAFIVFASTFSGAMNYLTREERGELFELLGKFSFEDEDVRSNNPKVDMILEMTKPNMIAAEKRHQMAIENGTKGKAYGKLGGRPRKNEIGVEINPQITPIKPLNNNKDIEVDINKNRDKNKDKEINKDIDKKIERERDRNKKEDDNTNETINQLLTIISKLLVSSKNGSISNSDPLPSKEEQMIGNETEKDNNPNYTLFRQIRDELRQKAKQDNTKPLDDVNCRIVDEVEMDNTKLIDGEPTPSQIKHEKQPDSDDSKLLQGILRNIINRRTMGYEVEEDYLENAYLIYAQIHNIMNLDYAKKDVDKIIEDNLNGNYSDDDET